MSLQNTISEPQTAINATALSAFMHQEDYSLPHEWSWMDAAFASIEVENGIDLLRVGPLDIGELIDEMAIVFTDGGDDKLEEVVDLSDYRRRVAGFEYEVLSSLKPGHGKIAEIPLAKLARQSEWLEGLPFATRRRATKDVSDRLDYELHTMEIALNAAKQEAKARFEFLDSVHKGFITDVA
jgi:hypothetical protein